MTYIVTWIVVSLHIVTCPNNRAYTDDYGVTHLPAAVTCQLCYDRTETPNRKTFSTKAEAELFIKLAPFETYGSIGAEKQIISKMRLDSADAWLDGGDTR